MATLASQNIDMGSEKADVCYVATMVMGVGTELAAIDDQAEIQNNEPIQKKAKT